jgi:hypothetical protein
MGTKMGLVKIKGNRQCLNLYSFMYSKCPVFLARKKSKFEYVINEQQEGRMKDTNLQTQLIQDGFFAS